MSTVSDSGKLTKEFLAERDTRVMKMRQAGVAIGEIARRFGMSTTAVNAAIKRQLDKLNREALLAYPEILRMELERLNALQQAIWPLTQHRKVRLDDGTEVPVEPDLRAVAEVRAIMAARSKLLGIEQTNINIQLDDTTVSARAAFAVNANDTPAAVDAFNPEVEARKMLEVMAEAGILPQDTIDRLLDTPALPAAVDDVIHEAEVVHDVEVL
jgi:hypothetical protein